MKIYYPGSQPHHTLSVAPAAHPGPGDHRMNADWLDGEGAPVTFQVQFVDRTAEVDKSLGEFLIKHGYAQRTKLLLPQGRRAA